MIRRGLIAGGVVAVVVGAVWVVPRVMDWGRYRGAISALAAERLGRPVTIEGEVGLTILPQPVLTAGRISVTDPVTGAVFTAREMRLRVGLLGLFAGRIDPKALDLEGAVLRLPWPLAPDGFRLRPPPAFAATLRGGTLIVGGATVDRIDGMLATDGDEGGAVLNGSARLDGVTWGFEGSLAAVGADHLSALSGVFTGAGSADGAMLRVNGELSDQGAFSGDMVASGPDLGAVLPAPHVGFGAEAKIEAAGTVLTGSDLTLELGQADGRGSFRWQGDAPQFGLSLVTTRLDLDRWSQVWLRPAGAVSSRFDIKADAAQLAGGTLRDVHLDLESGDGLVLHDFTATLPGETALRAQGTATVTGAGVQIGRGVFSLKTGDITPTVSWLAAVDADLPSLPGWSPLAADLTGNVTGGSGAVSVTGLKGTLGGVVVAGNLALAQGDRSKITADLTVDQLPLGSFGGLSLSPKLDYDLQVAAKSASWGSVLGQNLAFHLVRDGSGTRLQDAKAMVLGAVVTAKFDRAADGTVTDSEIAAQEPSLAPLLAQLPADGWQGTPDLAKVPLDFDAQFKGPVKSLTGKITLDAGDTHVVVLPVIDLPDMTASGALRLRDPGAWRLVQRLGGPDVAPWLGVGSVGALVRFNAKPGHFGVDYLDMAFGGMRLAGGLNFDETNGNWAVNGQLNSDRLPIAWPALTGSAQLPVDWLKGGSGKISLAARKLTWHDVVVANDLHTDLSLTNGVVSVQNLGVTWGDGSIAGGGSWRALDAEPSLNLEANFNNVALADGITGGTVDVTAGNLTGDIMLTASGHTPSTMLDTLSGQLDANVADGKLVGFDLARAQASVAVPGVMRAQSALLAALKTGGSDFTQLHVAADIKDGGLTISSGNLWGAVNAELSGIADLPGGAIDLGMVVHLPGGAPPVAARYKGPMASPGVTVDVAAFKKWLGQRGKATVARGTASIQHR